MIDTMNLLGPIILASLFVIACTVCLVALVIDEMDIPARRSRKAWINRHKRNARR